MSSGKVHDRSIAFSIPLIALISPTIALYASTTGVNLSHGVILISYIAGGFLLSPDIDLKQSNPSNRWFFLSGLWYPYRKLSGHRGFSHLPIFGTLSRMLYLGTIVYAIMLLCGINPPVNTNFLLSVFIGLEISALVHLIFDYIIIIKK